MTYTALYRKYRPQNFSEIVGQDHIIKTLKNQIVAGRVGHAYLLNGSRGTGKTSTAKVLARAINCLNPKDGEPCNECEICKGAISGSLTDIVEMDAASNNSVEDIRLIREEVNFLPTLAKYRVYIIDEVHMLSTGAFNALLKTLEEPPSHVKFILATTEPQKLPATILSRCQRFDFKRISNSDIIKNLEHVCKSSNIEISKQALNIIAVLSEGALRDALSILERCIQDGQKEISEEKIKELVGIPKLTYINKIANGVLKYNIEETLDAIQEVMNEGKDINNLLWELLKYIKDILVYKTNGKLEIYNEQEIKEIESLSQNASKQRLIDIIYSLSDMENTMKWSSQKLIVFQAGIIKLCNKQESGNEQELEKRISSLEDSIRNLGNIPKQKEQKIDANNVITNKEFKKEEFKKEKPQQQKKQNTQNACVSTNSGKPGEYWSDIVNKLKANGKIMLYTNLLNTTVKEINDMVVGIEFPNGITSFGKTVLEKTENINEISKLVSITYGKEMRIKYIDMKKENPKEDMDGIEDLARSLDIPINVIEE